MSVADMVRAAADGDRSAWNALVDRYTGLLWAVARAHRLGEADAADVVQTTWLRLVEHLDRLTEPERVNAWLATTARRECLRVVNARARQIPVPADVIIDAEPTRERFDLDLLTAERDQSLWTAFALISHRCQMLLRMLMADPPPSYDVVGAALDMPIGSIGPTRQRCLEALRQRLAGVGFTNEALDF
jgi:RNA polymerase sigma factor (sigma-70 family)